MSSIENIKFRLHLKVEIREQDGCIVVESET
jgi:hypothetical protein